MEKAVFFRCPDCNLYYHEDIPPLPCEGAELEEVEEDYGKLGWEQTRDKSCGCRIAFGAV